MKPYETISDANGKLVVAGVDGAVLEMETPPAWLDTYAPDGEGDIPVKSTPRLCLKPMAKVRVRFTDKSFLHLGVRLARHYWHGVWLDCPEQSHSSLVPEYAQGKCPLCVHLPVFEKVWVPVIWEDGTEWPQYRLLEVDGRVWPNLKAHLLAHPNLDNSTIIIRGSHGVEFKPAGRSPLNERQLNAARLGDCRLPAAFLHRQLQTLADCIANNLEAKVEDGRLEEIEEAMPGALFIPFLLGTKMAALPWKMLRHSQMGNEYYRWKLQQMNIALACGPVSDNYCTADIDDDEGLDRFVCANPWARGTQFSSSGNRGGNFHFQLQGKYPAKVVRLLYKQRAGSKIVKPYGEFRCGDCTTTLSGYHPAGLKYTLQNLGKIPVITADELKVPEGVVPQQTIIRVNAGVPKRKGRGIDLNKIEGLRRINCGWTGRCPVCAESGRDTKMEHLIVYRSGAYACISQCDTREIYHLVKRLGLDGERGVDDWAGNDPEPQNHEEDEEEDE